jgi:ankyrin repeat protein
MQRRNRNLSTLALSILLLLTGGCFLFPPAHSNYRAIHEASINCEPQRVQAILATNAAAVNLPDDSKRTPLHDAASENCTNVIAILLHAGAKLEAKDQAGETPLHVAAQEGCADAVTVLVRAGASLAARDKAGNTPLARAIAYKQKDVADLLRKLGAQQ